MQSMICDGMLRGNFTDHLTPVSCCVCTVPVVNVADYANRAGQPLANINNNSGSPERNQRANISGLHQSFRKISVMAVRARAHVPPAHQDCDVLIDSERFSGRRPLRSRPYQRSGFYYIVSMTLLRLSLVDELVRLL